LKTRDDNLKAGRRRLARVAAACLIPVFLAGFSLYAQDLMMTAWNAVAEYRSPYLFELEPQDEMGRAATEGVMLIIVDGLRLDNSKKLETFNRARAAGADLSAVVGQPSLSDPAAAVIPSGTWQEIHGVTTNWYEGELRVDHLFDAARRSGKTTAVIAGKGWVDLYGGDMDRMYEFDDSDPAYDEQVYRQALAVITGEEPLPDLLVVHFGGLDHASHAYGGVSPQAMATAEVIDGYIADLLDAWDLSRRTAILTSDHGHIDSGGHGGWEEEVLNVPLVFVGQAVDPGPKEAARQVDIAPTICALLGMSMPSHTVGTVLDEVITLPPSDLARALITLGLARYEFSRSYVATVAEPVPSRFPDAMEAVLAAANQVEEGSRLVDEAWVSLVAGDPGKAVETAGQGIELMDKAREDVKRARLEAERGARLPLALVLALVPLLPLVYLGRNRWFAYTVGGAVLYFAVFNLLFFVVHGFQWSLSVFNEEHMIPQFITSRMLETALTMIVIGTFVGLLAGLRRRYDGPELAEAAATFCYLVVYGIGLQLILFYHQYGVSFGWFIPDLLRGFKFYVDLMQAIPAGFASIVAVPAALLGAKLGTVLTRSRSAVPPA